MRLRLPVWERWLPLLDNPVYQRDLGAPWKLRLGKRRPRRRRHPVWFRLGVAALAAVPYLAGASYRTGIRLAQSGVRPFGVHPDLAGAIAAVALIHVTALLGIACVELGILGGALSLARERQNQTIEALLVTRMPAAEVLLAKAAAIAGRPLAALSACCVAWLVLPPLPAGAAYTPFSYPMPVRAFTLCLWADGLIGAAACTFLGLAMGARCRSAARAAVPAILLALAIMAPGVAVFGMHRFVWWVVFGHRVLLPGLGSHIGVWIIGVATTPLAFALGQLWLDPALTRVRFLPPGGWSVPAGRPVAAAVAATLALLALGGSVASGVLTWRASAVEDAFWDTNGLKDRVEDLIGRGRHAEAIVVLDDALHRDIPDEQALLAGFYKARCLEALGKTRQAVAALGQARRHTGDTPMALCALEMAGSLQVRLGDRAQALRSYREAVRLAEELQGRQPAVLQAHGFGGEVVVCAGQLLRLGDRQGALAACRRSEHDPDGLVATRAKELGVEIREGLDRSPRLGVVFGTRAPFALRDVEPGRGANAAGLKPGDVPVSVAGQPFAGRLALLRVLAHYRVGDGVPVVVRRGGKEMGFRVKLSAP